MRRLPLILLFLGAIPAAAQQGTTAEIGGRVSSGGQPLPGVTVTLASARLQGSRVAVTGANGGFLVPFLPPGAYELTFELDGFTTARESTAVALGAQARVDVELAMAAHREAISVAAPDPTAGGAAIAMNLRAPEIDLLPIGRDLRSIVLLSPSASVGRGLMIAGAPSWDSLFLVDGVVANEYQSGQPQPVLFEDAIAEVVVLSGAIPAEFGRFTGGVVSTITEAGGNEIHGSLRDRITNGSWQEATPWPGEAPPLDEIHHAVEGTLGGFLLRDRLWFFLAARDARSAVRRFTALTNVAYPAESDDRRAQAKVTARLSSRHSLVASLVTDALEETNAISGIGRVLETAALIPERKQPVRLGALTSTAILPGRWFTEVHHARGSWSLRGNGGRSTDRILGTLVSVRGPFGSTNAPFGCGICGEDRRESSAWSAKATHYRDSRFGDHTLVVGGDVFRETRRNRGTRSASEFNVDAGAVRIVGSEAYPFFGAGTSIIWTPYFVGERGSDLGTASAFVSDRWDVSSRLTLGVGARWDRNRVRDALSYRVSDDAGISPRLSAAWDPRGDGAHRLFASYGRYAAKILEGGASPRQVGIFNSLTWRYRGPEINTLTGPADQLVSTPEALARLFAWFDSVGGVANRTFLAGITNPDSNGDFDGTLKSPAVDEWSVGYAIASSSASLRIDYVSRDWTNFYAARVDTTTGQRLDAAGNTIDVVRIVNDDSGTVRTYRALQLQGQWRRGALSAGGGYTLSKLRGNDEGEESVSAAAPRNLPLAFWYPEFLGYERRRPVGYLRQDQRHRARAWVTWEGEVGRNGLTVSLLQRLDSGTPYSEVADIDATGRFTPFEGVPPNPGYTFNQGAQAPYFFSDRGAFRTDDAWSTDLAVGYELAGRYQPLLRLEVFNLFDRAAVVAPGTEVLTRQRAGATSGLQAFNPFTATPVEGVHYVRAASFGSPTGPESYQTPRRFQISVGVRF